MPRVLIASARAPWSTMSPRDVFTKIAPFLIAPKNFASTSPRVSGVDARWTLTTSLVAASSAGVAQNSMPSSSARSGVSLRDHAATCICSAWPRTETASPMAPSPTIPSVRPVSPRATPYSFFRQRPSARSRLAAGILLSAAIISPTASSATAAVLRPGQFATDTPFSLAASISMVFTPAPARMISASLPAASMVSRVTRVDRTTRTSASPIVRGRSSADNSGWTRSSAPRVASSSTAASESLSAMSMISSTAAPSYRTSVCAE